MNKSDKALITRAKEAAIKVLLHNAHGPYKGLPRTAGWGYPEPYTRDLMVSSLGILLTRNSQVNQVPAKNPRNRRPQSKSAGTYPVIGSRPRRPRVKRLHPPVFDSRRPVQAGNGKEKFSRTANPQSDCLDGTSKPHKPRPRRSTADKRLA